jgi:hypothetical protein
LSFRKWVVLLIDKVWILRLLQPLLFCLGFRFSLVVHSVFGNFCNFFVFGLV